MTFYEGVGNADFSRIHQILVILPVPFSEVAQISEWL